jgi:hypothetical protein
VRDLLTRAVPVCLSALQFSFSNPTITNLNINTCPGTRGVASFENFLRSAVLHWLLRRYMLVLLLAANFRFLAGVSWEG